MGLLLTIACVNVAGLLVTRASARQHETALRLAIGAGRGRLIRQQIAEGLLLALPGGALGLLAAQWFLALVVAARPASLSRLDAAQIDVRVYAFAALVSVAWGVLVSLAPLAQVFRTDVTSALRQGSRTSVGGGGLDLRRGLRVAQIAVSCVLLVLAGLLARGFSELWRVDAGFDGRGVLTFKVSLAGSRHVGPEKVSAFSEALRERLSALPGVGAAGATSHLPFDTVPNWGSAYLPEDSSDRSDAGLADARAITPGYFEAVGAQILEGRPFSDADRRGALAVAIVDERLAARLWPRSSPLGRRLKADPGTTGQPGTMLTVVGVVRHLRHRDITRDLREQIYFPAAQSLRNPMANAVRTSGDPAAVAREVRSIVAELDPALPIYDMRPLEAYTREARALQGFTMTLGAAFAASALLLAAVGVYGVTAYGVSRRRREFGLRYALGAAPRQITGLVLREGTRLAATATAIGCLAAAVAAPLIQAQLYNVRPFEPAVYAAAAATVIAAALVASWAPARRASRTAPLDSLREG